MEQLNIINILNRDNDVKKITDMLTNFEKNKHNTDIKRGMYIYGAPGCGKTSFVKKVLRDIGYDIISYDAGDIRNKNVMDTITKHNMTDRNIMCMFRRQVKKIAIVMDEIDGMNSGDKGGINALIKLIREKKTKKQKEEEMTYNPIICIGNYHIDKKIKELMKVCDTIELKLPNADQCMTIVSQLLPDAPIETKQNIVEFSQGDIRRIQQMYNIYINSNGSLSLDVQHSIFQLKSYNEDTKKITKNLINNQYSFNDHNKIMNETDRTIVGLLWHENIIDVLVKMKFHDAIHIYLKILKNMCFADFIDRITFQKQIWQFNEMSSIIKTFYNNKLYHEYFLQHNIRKKPTYNPSEVRFTKVLTKYSTEYNNSTFIQLLCHQLGMDKKDLYSFFCNMKNNEDQMDSTEMMELFDNCDITTLDIKRIFRYLDRSVKNTLPVEEETDMAV
jgi:DNA polymerase III delta prime subunit